MVRAEGKRLGGVWQPTALRQAGEGPPSQRRIERTSSVTFSLPGELPMFSDSFLISWSRRSLSRRRTVVLRSPVLSASESEADSGLSTAGVPAPQPNPLNQQLLSLLSIRQYLMLETVLTKQLGIRVPVVQGAFRSTC